MRAAAIAGGRPDDLPAALTDEDHLHRAALPCLPRPPPLWRTVPGARHSRLRHCDFSDPIGRHHRPRLLCWSAPLRHVVDALRSRRCALHASKLSPAHALGTSGRPPFRTGIYSEKLLKGRPSASIHWQNIQLYTWGILFNAVGVFLKDRRRLASRGMLTGYEFWAWSVVLCNALNGLAISAVLKYADNIARVYAHAIAMVVTMLASIQLFDAHATPQLVIAVLLVATSTLQYNLPKVRVATRCQPKRQPDAMGRQHARVHDEQRERERVRLCARPAGRAARRVGRPQGAR